VALMGIGLALCWLAPNTWQWRPPARLAWAVPSALLLLLAAGVCLSESYSPYLYFQD
jgi:hypothetical protein